MNVKVKVLNHKAVLPIRLHDYDRVFDIHCLQGYFSPTTRVITYDTGLEFVVPDGFVGLLLPLEFNSKNNMTLITDVVPVNEELKVSFRARLGDHQYGKGEKICRVLFIPSPEVQFSIIKSEI
jgi:hypothetical protein